MAGAENNIVGEVGLKVVPVDPAAQFQAGVNQIIKRLEQQAQFQIKASGLDQITQQAQTAGQAFAEAAIQAAGFTAAVYAVRAAVEGAVNKLAGLFDQLAQARAGFTSILKSEAAGGALLADIREFARVSPFVTQELVNYSQQLLGVGVNAQKIVPLLEDVGNIVSSVGGDTQNIGRVLFTLTQIQSIGRLAGQDAMQLQSALIPITKYLSEFLGKTTAEIKKLQEQGQISADTVFAAISAQGDKVQGAMANATRNISGARAVLSDTITILLQDQPVLNKIFEDTYKAILAFANSLSEPQFQLAFERFFDGVDKVYEGLKPLFSSLAEFAGSGALGGLDILATVMNALGTALSAIPEGVLEIVARVFLALSVLKAPLLLISYVTSIQRMATAILPAVGGLGRLTAATAVNMGAVRAATAVYNNEIISLNANTAALTANQRARLGQAAAAQGLTGGVPKGGGRLGAALSVATLAATVGGGILSASDDPNKQVAGGALTYAGIGGQLGLAAGPGGAAAGALIGGAIGAIVTYTSNAEKKAKAHVEEMKKLGIAAAEGFIGSAATEFSDENQFGAAFTAYRKQIVELQRQQEEVEAKNPFQNLKGGGVLKELFDEKLAPELALITSELEATEAAATKLFETTQIGLQALVDNLKPGQAAYEALTFQNIRGGRSRPIEVVGLEAAQKALEVYGITLAQVSDPAQADAIQVIIDTFDGLTTAQQNATREATKFNTALTDALKAADLIYGPQEKRVQQEISNIKVIADAEKAQYDQSTLSAKLAADEARFNAQKVVYAQAYAAAIRDGANAQEAALLANAAADKEFRRLQGLYGASGRDRGGVRKDAAPSDNVNPSFDFNLQTQSRNREAAEEEAERLRKEAEDAAEKAKADALAFTEKLRNQTESLTDRLEAAAENIASAAQAWVGSIKERTQYEQAVSAGTAIRNTQRQISDLTELSAGLIELRARGLTDEAIKSLGIDNVADLKQVRKLLKANPNDIGALSSSVSELNKKATDLATGQEDARTQKNIAEGIKEAADDLGIDFTKADSASLANQFTFNTGSNAQEIAEAILAALTSGAISR